MSLKHKVISITPTLDTSAYATGDRMGSVMTITGAVQLTGEAVKIVSVNVLDLAKQNAQFDILIFNQSPTVASADNAAIDLSDAEAAKLVAVIPIVTADYTTVYANNSQATKGGLGVIVKTYAGTSAVAASKDLYALLVSRGSPTFAADSLVIKLGLEY